MPTGTAIGKPTWGDVQTLNWGNLAEHQWWDFRFALVTGESEVIVQGVAIESGKTTAQGQAEMQIQGVRVDWSPCIIAGGSEMIVSVSVTKRDYHDNMLKYMPTYYRPSQVIDALLKTMAAELRKLEFDINTVRDSLFLDSVVENITRWEADLGLTPVNNKLYDFRREKVRAKLRAMGTTTKGMIQKVAATFSNGEAEVIEDNANSKFTVKFTRIKGIPENMIDLTEILNEIKPAHLAFSYDYTYNTWSFLVSRTWGQMTGQTWQNIQTYS